MLSKPIYRATQKAAPSEWAVEQGSLCSQSRLLRRTPCLLVCLIQEIWSCWEGQRQIAELLRTLAIPEKLSQLKLLRSYAPFKKTLLACNRALLDGTLNGLPWYHVTWRLIMNWVLSGSWSHKLNMHSRAASSTLSGDHDQNNIGTSKLHEEVVQFSMISILSSLSQST